MSTVAASKLFNTLLGAGTLVCLNSLPAADVTYIGPDFGSWGSPAAWSSGALPTFEDEIFIHTSGTADFRVKGNTPLVDPTIVGMQIDGGGGGSPILELSKSVTARYSITVGYLGQGAVEQTGGKLTTDYLWLGKGHYDSQGRYTLKKGEIAANKILVGNEGDGDFQQLGGTVDVRDWMVVGNGENSDSTYTLERGRLDGGYETSIGNRGHGVFEQKNGTATMGDLYLGNFSTGTGTVKQYGGKMYSESVFVGRFGEGTIEQHGGTHKVAENVFVSGSHNGLASYSVDGGTLEVGGRIIVGGTGGQSEFIQSGGSVSVAGGVEIQHGFYRLKDATLKTNGLIVGAGASFLSEGTTAKLQTTGNVSFDAAASIATRDASLIVGKGSNIALSAIQSDIGASAVGLSGQESWAAISLEKNVTLSLQGTAGVDAVYVNRLDIGSKNPFRVESIIVGNGVNMYYNADLRANKYLKGGAYDLIDGGRLIPVSANSIISTGISGGLIKGSGSLVLTGSNTYGPGEVVGGSLVLAGSSFAFELDGASDQIVVLGEGDLLELTCDSLSLFDFSAVDSSLISAGTFVLVGGDWQVYPGAAAEASGTLAEREFSAPTTSTVPEPTSAALALLGVSALCTRRRARAGNR